MKSNNNYEDYEDLTLPYDEEDKEHLHQPSKYDIALGKYETNLDDDKIARETAVLIEKHLSENDTAEVKKFLFHCIDLTTLKCTDSEQSVMKFTEKVNEFDDKYPDLDNVAAICVYPNMAEIVNDTLEADHVNIACVSGGFPSSQTFTEVKVAETAMALHAGADEIDIVIPVGKFLEGDYEGMCDEIEELKEVCGDKHLKVILETGALKTASNIKKASILSMYSGADFIKTSTGKENPAATPEAAYVMCNAIKEYHRETGRKIGFKPAGGINTVKDALTYYTIVSEPAVWQIFFCRIFLDRKPNSSDKSRQAERNGSALPAFTPDISICLFLSFNDVINISSQRETQSFICRSRQQLQGTVPVFIHYLLCMGYSSFPLYQFHERSNFFFRGF